MLLSMDANIRQKFYVKWNKVLGYLILFGNLYIHTPVDLF